MLTRRSAARRGSINSLRSPYDPGIPTLAGTTRLCDADDPLTAGRIMADGHRVLPRVAESTYAKLPLSIDIIQSRLQWAESGARDIRRVR
jgi:hypothetical protein